VDGRARRALEAEIRRTVGGDLDELAGELHELRGEVAQLRRATGLTTSRLALDERRELVRELRRQGLSAAKIAQLTGAHRQTILRDAAELGLPTPPATLGIDGLTRRHRSQP
jgi:hypothetical protein